MAADKSISSEQPLRSATYWELYRIFLTFAALGSHDECAATLGVSKSTLTRRLERLEAVLHSRLYYRHTGEFLLTPHGNILVKKLRKADELLENSVKNARHKNRKSNKKLRIFVDIGIFHSIIIPYLRINPEISEKYSILDFMDNRQVKFLENNFEIIISGLKMERKNDLQIRLGDISLKFFISKEYFDKFGLPTGNNLSRHSMIVPTGLPAIMSSWRKVMALERQCMNSIRVSTLVEGEALVRAGLGFGLISSVRQTPADIEVSSLPALTNELSLWARKGFVKDPEDRLMVDSLVSHARSLLCEDGDKIVREG